SGKSSLVRAGLFPRLRLNAISGSAGWPILDIDVTENPIRGITRAFFRILPRSVYASPAGIERDLTTKFGLEKLVRLALETQAPGGRLILFIDQFEEVFTRVSDHNNRSALQFFMEEAIRQQHLHFIIGLRADFLPTLLESRFSGLLNFSDVLWVQPLDDRA